jgi:hypothetical protein
MVRCLLLRKEIATGNTINCQPAEGGRYDSVAKKVGLIPENIPTEFAPPFPPYITVTQLCVQQ